jgi:uncharacterized protein (DUF2141 family)
MKKSNFRKSAIIRQHSAKVVFENIPDGELRFHFFMMKTITINWTQVGLVFLKKDMDASNDAKGNMGPPKYEDAKFQLTDHKSMTIKINN